jgi:hypothetical protein
LMPQWMPAARNPCGAVIPRRGDAVGIFLVIIVKESPCSIRPRSLRKNYCGTAEIRWPAHLGQQENTAQDAQKGQTSHPPNPGAPRRAFSQARPQRTIPFIWGGWDDPNCARPTRAFSSCALREQGDRPSYPTSFFSILLQDSSRLTITILTTLYQVALPTSQQTHLCGPRSLSVTLC